MKMTKPQAIDYCKEQIESQISRGLAMGTTRSIWSQLLGDIEREGLDLVEVSCTAWRDAHTDITERDSNTTWIVYGKFLDAIEDDYEIKRYIAEELQKKFEAELAKVEDSDQSIRVLYLRQMLTFLVNCQIEAGDRERFAEGWNTFVRYPL